VFFKTAPPVDPVGLITSLCQRVATEHSRVPPFVKRITPITKFAKASENGIAQLADDVLPPHFGEGQESKKVCGLFPLIPVSVPSGCDFDPHRRRPLLRRMGADR
jgi:hypothetical protein